MGKKHPAARPGMRVRIVSRLGFIASVMSCCVAPATAGADDDRATRAGAELNKSGTP